jgi:hypothetical protein
VELVRETCDWLTEPAVEWFQETVRQAVLVEFNIYIDAGDLRRTAERMAQIQEQYSESGGYVGMYL